MSCHRLQNLRVAIAVLCAIAAAAGCGPSDCPPGTSQMGYPPPKGKSLQCMKRIVVDGMGKEVPHGPFKKWYADGTPAIDATYVDGKKQGRYLEWWEKSGK